MRLALLFLIIAVGLLLFLKEMLSFDEAKCRALLGKIDKEVLKMEFREKHISFFVPWLGNIVRFKENRTFVRENETLPIVRFVKFMWDEKGFLGCYISGTTLNLPVNGFTRWICPNNTQVFIFSDKKLGYVVVKKVAVTEIENITSVFFLRKDVELDKVLDFMKKDIIRLKCEKS